MRRCYNKKYKDINIYVYYIKIGRFYNIKIQSKQKDKKQEDNEIKKYRHTLIERCKNKKRRQYIRKIQKCTNIKIQIYSKMRR